MSFKNDISLFFNLIKTSNENKVLFPLKIKYYKLKKILSILNTYGLILNYGVSYDKLFIIKNNKSIIDVYWFKSVKYVSAYKIKALYSKYHDNIYIVSTTSGIIDTKSAIKLNIGGYLLFVIKVKASLSQ